MNDEDAPDDHLKHLAYVKHDDPPLYSMLNNSGEIIVGGLYFRFLASSLVAVATTGDSEAINKIRSWPVDYFEEEHGILLVGYKDEESILYHESDNGGLSEKDIALARFDVEEQGDNILLTNTSFVHMIDGRPYSFRWIVDGQEYATSDNLTLNKADHETSTVRLELVSNDIVEAQTEDTRLETRFWWCDHKPVIYEGEKCGEYYISVRYSNREGNTNVRFTFNDGTVIQAQEYRQGGARLHVENVRCIDGMFNFHFELYDVRTGEVYCKTQYHWPYPCEVCDCDFKDAVADEEDMRINGPLYRVKTRLWISDNLFGSSVGSFTRTRRRNRWRIWQSYDADSLYCSFEGTLRDLDKECEPIHFPFYSERIADRSYLARNINPGTGSPRYIREQDLVRSTHYAIIDGVKFEMPALQLP